jgi:hypothetical protein
MTLSRHEIEEIARTIAPPTGMVVLQGEDLDKLRALAALALQALDAGQPVAPEAMIAAAIDCANWPPDLSAIVEAVMDETDPLDFSTEQCIALGILLDRNRRAPASSVEALRENEPPQPIVDALNEHFERIGVTTKVPSVLAYDVWNIVARSLAKKEGA